MLRLAAETPEDALRKERRAERVLLALETLLEPLPSRVRWGLEVASETRGGAIAGCGDVRRGQWRRSF